MKFITFTLLLFAGYAAADDGDDFSNNLFSDLAPLLALFGERVAMQFMSQSLGWADHFILAMAPIGIITIIVSAIRVGGPSLLKAIIGRARENIAVAEAELMSSTSKDVCELWNGYEIVRCMGSAPVTEFICLLPDNVGNVVNYAQMDIETMALEEALDKGYLVASDKGLGKASKQALHLKPEDRDAEGGTLPGDPSQPKIIIVRDTAAEAPNISLNSHPQVSRVQLRIVAMAATILQFAVLTFGAFATYYPTWKFLKDDRAVEKYAFPCTAVGTLTLVSDLLVCSHVVESSTMEKTYTPGPGRKVRMVWLQKTQTVSDQHFGSYAIFAPDDRKLVITSHRVPKGTGTVHVTDEAPENTGHPTDDGGPFAVHWTRVKRLLEGLSSHSEAKAVIGTILSLFGFIIQFIGLRGMHWSASIAQLVAILIMMALRAWVRRGLSEPPDCIKLTPGFELDWFATTLGDIDNAPWLVATSNRRTIRGENAYKAWTVRTGHDYFRKTGKDRESKPRNSRPSEPLSPVHEPNNPEPGSCDASLRNANEVLNIRRKLGELTNWHGPGADEALLAAKAIEVVMDNLFDRYYKVSELNWSIYARFGSAKQAYEPVNCRVTRQENGRWNANPEQIKAILSLWLYSVDDHSEKISGTVILQQGGDKQPSPKGSSVKASMRLLGPYTEALDQSIEWWMPREASGTVLVEMGVVSWKNVEGHRLVGCSATDGFEDGKLSAELFTCPETTTDATASSRNEIEKAEVVAANTYSSLVLLYSQDLFSSFMCKNTPAPVAGIAEIQQIDNTGYPGSWKSFKLRNAKISKMVQAIESIGFGNSADIYLSIIPALSVVHKLPEAETVVSLALEHAETYERVGQLREAGSVYEWLLRTVAFLPPENRVRVKAAVVSMEYRRQLSIAAGISAVEDDFNQHFELTMSDVVRKKALKKTPKTGDLEECINSIDQLLRKLMLSSGILSNLMRMHYAQGRGWVWDLAEEDMSTTKDLEEISYLDFTDLHRRAIQSVKDHLYMEDALRDARNPNRKDIMGWTPLHYIAALWSNVGEARRAVDGTTGKITSEVQIAWPFTVMIQEIVGKLDTNACDLAGWTPLHHACIAGHEDIAMALIEKGAYVNVQGRDGKAPLHCASMQGHVKLVRFLIEAGAAIDVLDPFRATPLHWAARRGHESVVEYLLPDASMKLRDYKGRTPLMLAVAAGQEKIVTQLLGYTGVSEIEARDRMGRTPLHLAAEYKREGIVQSLIEGGAHKDAVCGGRFEGFTPLHFAVRVESEAIVKLLIDAGADRDAIDTNGLTALDWAKISGPASIKKLLVDAGSSKRP